MGNAAVYALKIAIIAVAILGVAGAAIVVLTAISTFATNTALGEIIGLISIYLPFNAATVFGLLLAAMSVLLIFICAKKVFEFTINAQESA